MARKSVLALAGACLLSFGFAQGTGDKPKKDQVYPLRTVEHNAFKAGEKLTYILHYGLLNAGEATLELKEGDREIQGRKILHATGKGRSVGAFKAFYKVDDLYETYMDAEGVFPWVFIRRVEEGDYSFSQDYLYMQHRRQVTTQEKKTFDVPAHVQDMLSAFYFARTLDFSNAQPGQEYTIDCFMDNEYWPLRMRYVGKETVKLRNGRYRCLKFQPIVQEGRIFKTNEDLNVWITDDGNHIPVLAQAKVLVGSIKMELSGYEGLAHPIAKE
ncbi:MAG: DUF3108 domain-containing protein [Bacteroidetes bacterium]|nr:DUF3108 domain-containing protein [Bacteroidota bacterium]